MGRRPTAIGVRLRRTAASEKSSPRAAVWQCQLYLQTGHRGRELRGARTAGSGRDCEFAAVPVSRHWQPARKSSVAAVGAGNESSVPAYSVEKLGFDGASRAIRVYEPTTFLQSGEGPTAVEIAPRNLYVALEPLRIARATRDLQMSQSEHPCSIEFFNRIGHELSFANDRFGLQMTVH